MLTIRTRLFTGLAIAVACLLSVPAVHAAESESTQPKSVSDAIAQSKKTGRPVLLAVYSSENKLTERKVKGVLEDEAIQEIASQMYVQPVDMSADGADAKAVKALREKHKLRPTVMQVVLYDANEDKVLYETARITTGNAIARSIEKVMPKPKYTGEWLTDYDKAAQLAKELDRPMLLDFTGSDWCGWCIKLDNEVFEKETFKEYAKQNLILVKLDYPRSKPQSDEIKKQNQELLQKYGVRGFPTILLTDASGDVIGKTGYQAGGPEKYVAHLKEMVK